MIRRRHGKTPYELLHDKPPDLSYLHVFGALCYLTNDCENLGKLQPKADIGLMQTFLLQTPFVPPSRSDWDLLFQPMFDESLNPPPYVDLQAQKSLLLFQNKWTKDHPLENIIGDLDRPVSTRLQIHEQALFCYYDAFLTSVEPKNYKDALTQACWIKAMQKELYEFERLKVWELVPPPDKAFVITLKWIYKVKLDELGGILKNKARLVARGYRQEEGIYFEESFALVKYSFESCDLVDTPMVEKSKLDEDKEGKVADPSHYLGTVIGDLVSEDSSIGTTHLENADHAGVKIQAVGHLVVYNLWGDRLFNTTAGNPVKKILLKLNLSDHRLFKDGGGVKEFQRSFRHSDTERLSRSDEVLKLKNFKKDATLKLFKSTNQVRYEHVGPTITSSQDGKVNKMAKRDYAWLMISRSQVRFLVRPWGEDYYSSAMWPTLVVPCGRPDPIQTRPEPDPTWPMTQPVDPPVDWRSTTVDWWLTGGLAMVNGDRPPLTVAVDRRWPPLTSAIDHH
ncbi:retrovirus-related pol polyprotein from transposon TNT 1-94 [Tanacetum coccineum]|uniref:Retrovirus-related pol polyprotein from transposon TNT 1-94 n=1 Tax=Tanacetum coccineum TaxID=301880 RepID=A0ABQ5EG79_9ASTR